MIVLLSGAKHLMAEVNHQAIADQLSQPISSIKQRRRFIEYEWLKNYAAWQGWPNAQYYVSLADDSVRYFIPEARQAIEKIVDRAVKLLMPKKKWFEVQPFDDKSHQNAEAVDTYLRYILRKKIPCRRLFASAVRCAALYGFSAIRTSVLTDASGDVWPSQRSVDPYCFYVFPETATQRDDALLLFEETIVPYEVYKAYSDSGLCLPLDPSTLNSPEWPYHLIERFAYRGLTNPSDYPAGLGDARNYSDRHNSTLDALNRRASAFVELTDLYVRRGNKWFNGWLVWNINPTWSSNQSARSNNEFRRSDSYRPTLVKFEESKTGPMYRWSTYRSLPNELYTNGLMDDIRVLQTLFNNQVSQTEEARSMATTGPVVFNTSNQNRTQQFRWANREIWYTDTDIREAFNRVNFEDTSPSGIRAAQITLGLIDRLAGAGTIAEGQPGRNMPRSGFAVNNLINLSMSGIQNLVECLEDDIATPSLSDIHAVTMEYVPDMQILRIPGTEGMLPTQLRSPDLTGDFTYEWIASLEFQDNEVRAERLMAFLKLVIDAIPLLANEGYKFNLVPLIQTIWSDGLGERQITQIIQQMSPEEQAMRALTQSAQNGTLDRNMETQGGPAASSGGGGPGAGSQGSAPSGSPSASPQSTQGNNSSNFQEDKATGGSFMDILNTIRSMGDQVGG
jgi:hypothetical protein